jgi:hypothetical protein
VERAFMVFWREVMRGSWLFSVENLSWGTRWTRSSWLSTRRTWLLSFVNTVRVRFGEGGEILCYYRHHDMERKMCSGEVSVMEKAAAAAVPQDRDLQNIC